MSWSSHNEDEMEKRGGHRHATYLPSMPFNSHHIMYSTITTYHMSGLKCHSTQRKARLVVIPRIFSKNNISDSYSWRVWQQVTSALGAFPTIMVDYLLSVTSIPDVLERIRNAYMGYRFYS